MIKDKPIARGARRVFVCANGETFVQITNDYPPDWQVIEGIPYQRIAHACNGDENGPNAIVYTERPLGVYMAERERLVYECNHVTERLAKMPKL